MNFFFIEDGLKNAYPFETEAHCSENASQKRCNKCSLAFILHTQNKKNIASFLRKKIISWKGICLWLGVFWYFLSSILLGRRSPAPWFWWKAAMRFWVVVSSDLQSNSGFPGSMSPRAGKKGTQMLCSLL